MKTIEISYNPYRMTTKMLINKVDVCQHCSYEKFKEFIEHEIPLQTWIEPINYLDWAGFVNEVSDPEFNDEVRVIFSGRVIDFEDLKRSITTQNLNRPEETRVVYTFQHRKVLDDKILSQNIDDVVAEIKSDRFRELVAQRTTEGLAQKYSALDENYRTAKENVFYIVLAGAYSSGKSTLLNTLIRHDILPTSTRTCTSKNCRIRHDSSLGTSISLAGFGEKNEATGDEPIIIPKTVYDNDEECAAAFLEICPIKDKDTIDKYPKVVTMELGVDLSHLYPDSVSEDKFTIVLIDTPGMDSAQSSEDGSNRHAEIALEAISMESKPMIILCADANYYDNKSIGEFMREIISQAKEEGSGFNDRFLFLMNKSDSISYKQGETAEGAKSAFAEYLTDSSKWNIRGDENELKQLAENASHFVPRVFMTASLIAFAIQRGAIDFSDEELEDPYKEDLYDKLDKFTDKICGRRKRLNYYLSKYCDIPNYRKEEIEKAFEEAIDDRDDIRAAELQCGIISVELAIKDYIARYAYPIKVRGLLDTFEDILEDVDGFAGGIFAELKRKEKELGERTSEREEESERKKGVEEKIAALTRAKVKINAQLANLDGIVFDARSLREATSDFIADIRTDQEVEFIYNNPTVQTGQKSRTEVEQEIANRVTKIKNVFSSTLLKTNAKLHEIKAHHDCQLGEVFSFVNSAVKELERSGVFREGEYKFTDNVTWKMHFDNINSDNFASDMKKRVVEKATKTEPDTNYKKWEWRNSWNPFKKIASLFMADTVPVVRHIDGYYETKELQQSIAAYFNSLNQETRNTEESFKEILENSKTQVRELIERLIRELQHFLDDIHTQKARIDELGNSIDELNAEIERTNATIEWLSKLKEKIKGE